MIGQGHADRYLARDEIRAIVREGLDSLRPDGKRLLFIIPDGTRTMPMPRMFALFRELLAGKARAVDFLIALGTHQPMDDAALSKLVGTEVVGGRVGESLQNGFLHSYFQLNNYYTESVLFARIIPQEITQKIKSD